MPMPLSGTDGAVPGTLKPLLGMGSGRNSVDRVSRSSAEGYPPGGEYNVGVAMNRRERDEISGVEDTDSGVDTPIDYSRRLELFEIVCKVFAIPMEVRHVWSRIRFFPWFRATLTSWLYAMTKDHMKKHQREYRQFLAEIGPEAFKRPLLTHRNAITTGWKRVGRVSRDNTKVRESKLEEDLAKNVSLSLHNSFCLNRESIAKGLPRAEGVDAILRAIKSVGRDRNQLR